MKKLCESQTRLIKVELSEHELKIIKASLETAIPIEVAMKLYNVVHAVDIADGVGYVYDSINNLSEELDLIISKKI